MIVGIYYLDKPFMQSFIKLSRKHTCVHRLQMTVFVKDMKNYIH